MVSTVSVAKPFRGLGGFFGMALDTFVCMFQRPFAWREYLLQTWFVARVSLVPTLMLSIPFTVLTVFTFNVLLVEFGAADFSGTGASLGTVNQTGPIVTVLVVAGAGATAMCADLGARTIRRRGRITSTRRGSSGLFAVMTKWMWFRRRSWKWFRG